MKEERMTHEPDDTQARALRRLTDATVLIIAYPAAESDRLVVLRSLASRIQAGRTYTEHEINELIQQHVHPHAVDYVTMRRDLVDYQFIFRTDSGSRYWRSENSQGIPPRIELGSGIIGFPPMAGEREENQET
jgi:hypothetical protein